MNGHEQRGDTTARDTSADLPLELLAIEEQFMAQTQAGEQPRLFAYVVRYPAHAAALVAWFASAHEPASPAESAAPISKPHDATSSLSAHMAPTSRATEVPTGLLPSAGVQHALHRLFGTDAWPHDMLRVQNRVAEQPTPYGVDAEERAAPVRSANDTNDEPPA